MCTAAAPSFSAIAAAAAAATTVPSRRLHLGTCREAPASLPLFTIADIVVRVRGSPCPRSPRHDGEALRYGERTGGFWHRIPPPVTAVDYQEGGRRPFCQEEGMAATAPWKIICVHRMAALKWVRRCRGLNKPRGGEGEASGDCSDFRSRVSSCLAAAATAPSAMP